MTCNKNQTCICWDYDKLRCKKGGCSSKEEMYIKQKDITMFSIEFKVLKIIDKYEDLMKKHVNLQDEHDYLLREHVDLQSKYLDMFNKYHK